jgi:hypothetical protein
MLAEKSECDSGCDVLTDKVLSLPIHHCAQVPTHSVKMPNSFLLQNPSKTTGALEINRRDAEISGEYVPEIMEWGFPPVYLASTFLPPHLALECGGFQADWMRTTCRLDGFG